MLRNKLSNEKMNILQYIYIIKKVLAQAIKDKNKMQLKNMELVTDEKLVELKDGLI